MRRFSGGKFVFRFTNYKIIRPIPMYEYIFHGLVMIDFKENLLSPLEVLKYDWVIWWVLNQLYLSSNLLAELGMQLDDF
jgi:hypothetical protein